MNDANEYQTRDFYIAAYLLAKGHRIAHVNRNDPQRVFFAFNDFDGREDLLRDFLYCRGQVEPQAFITAIKNLKGVIHDSE
jgi:hypothetical protein